MNEAGKRLIRAALKTRNLNMKSASLGAGLGETYVRDALKRRNGGRVEELAKLAAFLGIPLEHLTGESSTFHALAVKADPITKSSTSIFVAGKVAAGIWFESDVDLDSESQKPSMFPPDPTYPIEAQFDLEVIGTSLDRVAREGELLRCVDFDRASISPQNGDLVIVQRTRMNGSLLERTAKYYYQMDGRIELRPHSTDPRWQSPLVITGDETADDVIEVKALVLYAYRPLGRNRA